ncbi:unknown [Choristoneura occidentalis granulovirus]|uniref:PIF-3 n=1 Tax=Choristoneura occidentalis granulovirus TaxID=364745 RepID=Q1A4S0_9BBAC|nr:unknown [Choristoneura fumiferana granulovirus]ABC61160.1 unknown [Choristoneura fumiferana granulovirus]
MWWLGIMVVIILIAIHFWIAQQNTYNKRVNILFQKHNILDCNNVHVPCLTDDQCRDNCIDGMVMRCDQGGFCNKGPRIENINDCDANRGLIVVLNAINELVVETMCLSLYRDVINDDGSLKSYVCQNGNMELQLQENPFEVKDCQCASGYTLFSFSPGAFTRTIPICIPNRLTKLYSRVYNKPVPLAVVSLDSR